MSRLLVALAAVGLLAACAQSQDTTRPPDGLQAFTSDAELDAFVRDLLERQARVERSAPQADAEDSAAPEPSADESVTNVQHAGVDEGGIVKVHGDHLVVLRRGRLFTVDIGGDRLAPVSAVDAFGPDVASPADWYDEMLLVGDAVVVIGYSYARGGTELSLFDIDASGRLEYRSTYQMRSNDYYSAENYASRVVDGKLVFYTPLAVDAYGNERVADVLPALRRWQRDEPEPAFVPIASAPRVYRPARELDGYGVALHTVTTCAVGDGQLDCEATAVFGPFGHTFYVSPTAVYVWLSTWDPEADDAEAIVYRLPLDGSQPRAVGAAGGPIDQFSFLEGDDQQLHVLVGGVGAGQWMWGGEVPRDSLRLLAIPLAGFGNGRQNAPEAWYRDVPPVQGMVRNRFVGDHLLYGTSALWDDAQAQGHSGLTVVNWRTGASSTVPLPHATERIEALGQDAVVVGADGADLRFTSLRLGSTPAAVGQYTLSGAAQGETRSHGFFYRATEDGAGVLGLPVRRASGDAHGDLHASLDEGSAQIVYVSNRALALAPLGALAASAGEVPDDACRASCVDWYGNARPLFLRGRTLALLGYEIVEGELRGGEMRETRRVSFAPRPSQEAQR